MTARKIKLADVLWRAANKHLSETGYAHANERRWKVEFSCNAVSECFEHIRDYQRWSLTRGKAMEFLQSLGCPTGRSDQTFGTSDRAERQQRRYMWLLLAMHVAEDEGIEVSA